MTDKKITKKLNDLIQLDTDAVLAYQQAIEACEVPEVHRQLKSFQDDHQRHIGDLAELVRAAGGEPAIKRDLMGFLIEGFTAVMSRGDRSALMAMRGNEVLTTRTYESALKAELSAEARAVVERNLADESRHLAWIQEAIHGSFWNIKEGADAVGDEPRDKGEKRTGA